MGGVLLVQKDAGLRLAIAQALTREGFEVHAVATAPEAHDHLEARGPGGTDALLLDMGSAHRSGLELLEQLRAAQPWATCILVLADRHEDLDRLLALGLGVDDCILRPVSTRELAARIRAALRRAAQPRSDAPPRMLRHGLLVLDLQAERAILDGQDLDLPRKEFELLVYFVSNPRKVLPRDRILRDVWGLNFLGESRTIDAHVCRLRTKLGASASIETVIGVGYRLDLPEV